MNTIKANQSNESRHAVISSDIAFVMQTLAQFKDCFSFTLTKSVVSSNGNVVRVPSETDTSMVLTLGIDFHMTTLQDALDMRLLGLSGPAASSREVYSFEHLPQQMVLGLDRGLVSVSSSATQHCILIGMYSITDFCHTPTKSTAVQGLSQLGLANVIDVRY